MISEWCEFPAPPRPRDRLMADAAAAVIELAAREGVRRTTVWLSAWMPGPEPAARLDRLDDRQLADLAAAARTAARDGLA